MTIVIEMDASREKQGAKVLKGSCWQRVPRSLNLFPIAEGWNKPNF
jgi:hypothetical protein